jgi:glycosyltransferase involved in cell wall biosynthesis
MESGLPSSSVINDKLVSIICLAYNTGSRLNSTLDSIKKQTFKNTELIIVDDCSADNTEELISEWISQNNTAAKFIRNEKNLGIGRSLNVALSHCFGQYLSIIGDDEWDPSFLEEMVGVIEKSPESVAMVYSKSRIFDKAANCLTEKVLDPVQNFNYLGYPRVKELFTPISIREDSYLLSREYFLDALFWSNPVIVFCVLLKLTALREIGCFEERYTMEDFPTWFRIATRYDVIYVDKCLASYNKYSYNTSDAFSVRIESEVQDIMEEYKDLIVFKETRAQYIKSKIKQVLRTRKGRNRAIFLITHPKLISLFLKSFYYKF